MRLATEALGEDPDLWPPNPAPALLAAGADLTAIDEAAQDCRSCPLFARATQTVFGNGPLDADLMLVGEQPGDVEDLEGEPFVGPSGRMLRKILDEVGVDPDETYMTNVVKHFKWKESESSKPRLHATPKRSEIRACEPWLEAELERVDPVVIVGLGSIAAKALLGPSVRITLDRGVPSQIGNRTAFATYHPSAVLRAGEDRDRIRGYLTDDLRRAAELAGIR